MTGVILAAGRGARLNGGRPDLPKCLVSLGGDTLLARNVRLLQRAGISEIVVGIGCAADTVRQSVRGVSFVENTQFAETNSLYSLWLMRHLLGNGFLVMNCDVLVHPQLLDDLLEAQYEDALLIHYRDDAQAYGEEEMKVRVRRGCVVEMSKTMAPDDADGENVGIVKFGAAGARLLIDEMDRIIGAGELMAWAPRAFSSFATQRPLHAIGTRGLPWLEIDFPEDYRHAIDVVLPRIERDLLSPRVARTA